MLVSVGKFNKVNCPLFTKNTVKVTACRADWNSLQGSLPNARTSLCDTLTSFNTSIWHWNNIYRSEKMEKHNSSPLKIFDSFSKDISAQKIHKYKPTLWQQRSLSVFPPTIRICEFEHLFLYIINLSIQLWTVCSKYFSRAENRLCSNKPYHVKRWHHQHYSQWERSEFTALCRGSQPPVKSAKIKIPWITPTWHHRNVFLLCPVVHCDWLFESLMSETKRHLLSLMI